MILLQETSLRAECKLSQSRDQVELQKTVDRYQPKAREI